ncbi:3-hydroxyacyl-ACP dehydratase FabZ [Fangia hongkongensis]|uniref:3-hydroxyacyl-ACP dehydratase FabZ n=2 Tax=Fangia hongkongensis TaxID=270495 RepID=UPI00037EB009|nr:3-hydroxyacyl-ACP dehydratase FabZ [Fangia hongkongensis]
MNHSLFNTKYLMTILPHRYPFLLIDKVTEFVPHELIVSVKNVTYNEWCFQGHFYENPIYPGVLLIESIAQSSIILFQESYKKNKIATSHNWVLVGIKSRFMSPVMPGDQVFFECRPIKMLSNGSIFLEAKALVNEKVVAKATLTVGQGKQGNEQDV